MPFSTKWFPVRFVELRKERDRGQLVGVGTEYKGVSWLDLNLRGGGEIGQQKFLLDKKLNWSKHFHHSPTFTFHNLYKKEKSARPFSKSLNGGACTLS